MAGIKGKVCFEITRGFAWNIRLIQTGRKRFAVEYGMSSKEDMPYREAAEELGSCIMHAVACEGNLDNE